MCATLNPSIMNNWGNNVYGERDYLSFSFLFKKTFFALHKTGGSGLKEVKKYKKKRDEMSRIWGISRV